MIAGLSPSLNQGASVLADESPILSSQIAQDLTIKNRRQMQKEFDEFSWLLFVALNWPANAEGKASKELEIGSAPDARRVWQSYPYAEEVFLSDVRNSKNASSPNNRLVAVAPHSYTFLESVVNTPLVDKKGNYIVYEIRLNPEEFEQVNKLWNNYHDEVKNYGKYDFEFKPSSMEVRAAWRLFDSSTRQEEKDRYYITEQKICIPEEYSITSNPFCKKQKLGLVGFHIAYKVNTTIPLADGGTLKKVPQWIWATFEQVDNLKDVDQLNLKSTLFQCESEDSRNCNQTTDVKYPYLWKEEAPYAVTTGEKEQTPTQVKRIAPILSTANTLNPKWQNKLEKSVWKYYQLIGSQWDQNPPCSVFSSENTYCKNRQRYIEKLIREGKGSRLANTTMETYIHEQETDIKNITCVNCHAVAQIPGTNNLNNADDLDDIYADFSYIFKFLTAQYSSYWHDLPSSMAKEISQLQ